MIRHWSFYDKATGLLTGQVFGATDEATLLLNIPNGQCAVEGEHDHLCHRVDLLTGEVVDYQPPRTTIEHDWDDTTKRWRLNAEASGRAERTAVALARIANLEANVQPRVLREVALSQPKAAERLQAIDDEIADLRKVLGEG